MTIEQALDAFIEAAREPTRLATFLPIERRLERGLMRAFADQERRLLVLFRRLRKLWPDPIVQESVGPTDWEPLFTSVEIASLRLIQDPLVTAMQSALQLGGDTALADLEVNLSFDLTHPAAVAYMDTAPIRVARINDATREMVRATIKQGLNEGWSYDRIAKELRARFRDFRTPDPHKNIRSRAHLIAVTETGDAYVAGGLAVGSELAAAGLTIEKRWLDTGDERECPICFSNAGMGWIPLDARFASGHDGPTAHPACRCDVEQRVVPAP